MLGYHGNLTVFPWILTGLRRRGNVDITTQTSGERSVTMECHHCHGVYVAMVISHCQVDNGDVIHHDRVWLIVVSCRQRSVN